MRIAYITPYQGPSLLKRRPTLHNRSLAATVKIELIAELLYRNSHEVEIISQGEVDKFQCRFYPSFAEAERFHPKISVFYCSALPLRFLTGYWEGMRARHVLKIRHRRCPFDMVIIYNMKRAQLACANYAIRCLGLPVILEYEDDVFVSVTGQTVNGKIAEIRRAAYNKLLEKVSGGVAVSPHLMSQLPDKVPKLLLRGVVDENVIKLNEEMGNAKRNWVFFGGTHTKSKGIGQLIEAWKTMELPDWELHIAGYGESTAAFEKMAEGNRTIVFHGVKRGRALAQLLCSARICINPHDLSETPGNVFAFKIIEYLAAGAHVVTTPMGKLENEIEAGITYLPNNSPEAIAATLKRVIQTEAWKRGAARYVQETYGPAAVSKSLDQLIRNVVNART